MFVTSARVFVAAGFIGCVSVVSVSAQVPPRAAELEAYSGLHRAAALGDAEETTRLIDTGADINSRDGYERTPLHALLVFVRAAQVVKLAVGEHQRAHVIELLTQLTDIDDIAEPGLRGPVLEGERRLDVPILPPDELPHRELVEVGFEARTDDRSGEIGHSWIHYTALARR